VAGAAAQFFFNSGQYTGAIEWIPTLAQNWFAVSTIYTATVTLTAKAGYTFEGVSANSFTYTGATSIINEANSGVVTVVFPATGSSLGSGILDVNLDFAGEEIYVSYFTLGGGWISGEYPESGLTIDDTVQEVFLSVGGDYYDLAWFVDGQSEPTSTGSFFNLEGDNYTAKTHTLTVRGRRNGILHSRILTFTVPDAQ
jgi:hypothetical protein